MRKNILIVIGVFVLVLLSGLLLLSNKTPKEPVRPGGEVEPRPQIVQGTKEPKANVFGLFEEASRKLSSGDEDGAIKDFEKIAEGFKDSAEAEKSLFELAAIEEKRGELVKARDLYAKILDRLPASDSAQKAQAKLEELNIKILFSPIETQEGLIYEIQAGDTLGKLAKRFNTTVEFITKSNNLQSTTIKTGKRLKICKVKFSIVIDKSLNLLTLKGDGKVVKTYKVSTGANNSTPTGTFTIITKVVDPTWYTENAVVPPGSPKNILGSRWLGLSAPGYGIHGSRDPETIGGQVTAGCVRMRNDDVEELYTIVPAGTEVVIEN